MEERIKPQQPICYDGEIQLSFVSRGGRTVAERTYRRGNSRISANQPLADGIPYYFLIATGGGYTEGEQYRTQITLDDQTHAVLTTQTPNYIYKCEHGRQTKQENIVKVGEDCTLEYYIDETIPYAKALFLQATEIDLGKGSSLILTDGLTAGWSADEAPFQYGQIGLKTRIRKEGELLLNDFLLIDPREEAMEQLGYFEGCQNFNSAVIIDENLGEAELTAMREHLETIHTPCRYGLSRLEKGGLVLRVLGPSADENRRVVRAWIDDYRENIRGFAPLLLRKGSSY